MWWSILQRRVQYVTPLREHMKKVRLIQCICDCMLKAALRTCAAKVRRIWEWLCCPSAHNAVVQHAAQLAGCDVLALSYGEIAPA